MHLVDCFYYRIIGAFINCALACGKAAGRVRHCPCVTAFLGELQRLHSFFHEMGEPCFALSGSFAFQLTAHSEGDSMTLIFSLKVFFY